MQKIQKLIIRHKAIFAVIAMVIFVGVAQLLYMQNKKTVVAETAQTDTFTYKCTGSDTQSVQCLRQKYQIMTKTKGVKATFATLKAAYQTDPSVRADCHQLTHVIGRTEADKVDDVDKAFSQGDNFCWSGYYHGVMESIAKRIGYANLPAKLSTICAGIKASKPYSFYHYNCVHGLGHGVMDVTDSDLFKSLKMCDLLLDSWERQSCYGGVFMENVMDEVNPDHHTSFFKADDPMYPCTAVDDTYKEQCYLMQTSHALYASSEDFAKVFDECGAIEPNYKDTCYQSLGRDASGNSTSSVGQTRATCMLGKTLDARENCVIGAVKDFVSYFHSDKQAIAFCKSLDSNLQETCLSTEKDYYTTF
ncbi:MAG TPA: hypothetical protein VLG47_07180 [Candidatus Saccharimonadales bacterium]|nr:hypothetical protein [Candidatus Saccharimonadales bacterium]